MEFVLLIVFALAIVVLIVVLIKVFGPGTDEETTGSLIPKIDVPRFPTPPKKSFKRCPSCHSTFTDQSLNYCLSDGTLLEGASNASDEMETVVRRWK